MAALPIPLPPAFTVLDAMIASGIDNTNLFDGMTPAERIATDIFGNNFQTCLNKTYEELDADFKSFSELTQAQGQIRLLPGVKRNVRAFIQWVCDQTRLGLNPVNSPFPVVRAAALIRRQKTHSMFIQGSKTLSEASKPKTFTNQTKWQDWVPTFLNYLRTIPGRDGVPLKYVCREQDCPDPRPNADFLDDYVVMAPLTGEAYTINAATVHTFIVNFISGNETAESKIQAHEENKDGRLDFKALKDYYEGVGIHAVEITKAESTLKTLFYSGEKKPHMWWDEFERQLTAAFTAFDRKEGRIVYSNEMKLRILIEKVNADFLAATKAGINISLTTISITMTYERAIQAFRNEVTRKSPPQFGAQKGTRRHINEVDGKYRRNGGGRGFKGRGGRGGHGRGGRGGRGNRGRSCTDSTFITLTDGQSVEYHPSFNFPPHIYQKMKQEDKDKLRAQRAEYNSKNKGVKRQIEELQHKLNDAVRFQNNDGAQSNAEPVPDTIRTDVSQVTTGTMFAGRNEQASQKSNLGGHDRG